MKHKILWLLLALCLTTLHAAQKSPSLEPLPQQAKAAHFAAQVLYHENYEHIAFDEKLSGKIFDNTIKSLDPEKMIFLQSDIDQFSEARSSIGLLVLREDLSVPFAMYNLWQQRFVEHLTYCRSLLKQGFNFALQDNYQVDRKNAVWPQSEAEVNSLWSKRVKNDWLRLKLAGKDDKDIVDILDKRYDNSLKSIQRTKGDDVFQIFMDAYATAYDPHTNYFGIRAAESFDISMKLSLTGIGAELQYKDEFVTIRHLVPGSPAALSGQLKAGDHILAVGQGEKGVMTDIIGMRIFDAVELIRGPEDSVVRLDVLPAEAGPDGEHKFVSLIRKKITLEQQAAKKTILDVEDGETVHHIGVIALPGFYRDFAAQQRGEKDFKSAARDVANFLEEFKQDHVDGVVLDLRNNGGGSVEEAIELTGLFVAHGPVMQQLDATGRTSVNSISASGNTSSTPVWNGPFGVLINHASASASEIFAAAIQDYGRGLVIGETSFGKGTTQAVINLDRMAKNETPTFGELKMTLSKWFRINGDAIQLRGVTPDITLPMLSDAESYGESSYDNALAWSHIAPAAYQPVGNFSGMIAQLMANHAARVSQDKEFNDLMDDIAEFTALRKKNMISLNEAERKKERDELDAKIKQREKDKAKGKAVNAAADAAEAGVDAASHQDDGLLPTERNFVNDKDADKKEKLDDDVLAREAAHIISDEVSLLQKKGGH